MRVFSFLHHVITKCISEPVSLFVNTFPIDGGIPSSADKPRAPFYLGFRVVPVASACFRQCQRLIPTSLARLKGLFFAQTLFFFLRHVFAFLSLAFKTGDVLRGALDHRAGPSAGRGRRRRGNGGRGRGGRREGQRAYRLLRLLLLLLLLLLRLLWLRLLLRNGGDVLLLMLVLMELCDGRRGDWSDGGYGGDGGDDG